MTNWRAEAPGADVAQARGEQRCHLGMLEAAGVHPPLVRAQNWYPRLFPVDCGRNPELRLFQWHVVIPIGRRG